MLIKKTQSGGTDLGTARKVLEIAQKEEDAIDAIWREYFGGHDYVVLDRLILQFLESKPELVERNRRLLESNLVEKNRKQMETEKRSHDRDEGEHQKSRA